MTYNGVEVHSDCLHFRGDIPCKPHKNYGVHCKGCEHYAPRQGRLLIIKLGATGDVIRTTPLLESLRERYKGYEFWWLSYSPEVVPSSVDKRMKYTLENIQSIQSTAFDVAINLDKDYYACALMQSVDAPVQYGYTLVDGNPGPANELSVHKFLTGIFDDLNQQNTKSYPQELMELCGFEWKGQEYVLDTPGPSPIPDLPGSGPIIGLNTGCGDRWISREWPEENWIALIRMLQEAGYRPLLLGGPTEDARNRRLTELTGATYAGLHPLPKFIAVMNMCDVVVTAVTMAMHITLALRKQLVLFNNIFNPYEFELYGRGVLIQPEKPCTCFFKHDCVRTDYRCMNYLAPETLFEAVKNRMSFRSHDLQDAQTDSAV